MTGAAPSTTLEQRELWHRKTVLKKIYRDYFERIENCCVPGRTVEIGGGSGNFRAHRDNMVSLDIQPLPWLDLVADAHQLPFADGQLQNLVMIDTLHHLGSPTAFFTEAARVLSMGGRIVMVEPEITPLSWLVYYFLHPEPVKLQVNPLAKNYLHEGRDPFAANQAIPHLLFTRYRNDFKRQFPSLAIRRYDRFSPFSYLLSGGFRHWSLLPLGLVSPLLTAERRLGGLLAPLLAFRLLAVIEKTAFHTSAAVE